MGTLLRARPTPARTQNTQRQETQTARLTQVRTELGFTFNYRYYLHDCASTRSEPIRTTQHHIAFLLNVTCRRRSGTRPYSNRLCAHLLLTCTGLSFGTAACGAFLSAHPVTIWKSLLNRSTRCLVHAPESAGDLINICFEVSHLCNVAQKFCLVQVMRLRVQTPHSCAI